MELSAYRKEQAEKYVFSPYKGIRVPTAFFSKVDGKDWIYGNQPLPVYFF